MTRVNTPLIAAAIIFSFFASGCSQETPSVAVAKCELEFNQQHASKYIGQDDDLLYQRGEYCRTCMLAKEYVVYTANLSEAYSYPPGYLDALRATGTGWETLKPAERTPEINREMGKIKEQYVWRAVARTNCTAKAWLPKRDW
jgi:hypothetical protein